MEAQVHPLQMKIQKLNSQLAENQRQFQELDQVYQNQLEQARDERDIAKRESLKLQNLERKYEELKTAYEKLQKKE